MEKVTLQILSRASLVVLTVTEREVLKSSPVTENLPLSFQLCQLLLICLEALLSGANALRITVYSGPMTIT